MSAFECFCPVIIAPLTSQVHSGHSRDHRGWIVRHHKRGGPKVSLYSETGYKTLKNKGPICNNMRQTCFRSLVGVALYMLARKEPGKTEKQDKEASVKGSLT